MGLGRPTGLRRSGAPTRGRPVQVLFSARAADSPSAPSLFVGEDALTDGQLELRSHQLVQRILAPAVTPGPRVERFNDNSLTTPVLRAGVQGVAEYDRLGQPTATHGSLTSQFASARVGEPVIARHTSAPPRLLQVHDKPQFGERPAWL